MITETLGQRVKLLRGKLSQDEFGQKYHLSRTQLAYLEQDRLKNREKLEATLRQITGDDEELYTWLFTGAKTSPQRTVYPSFDPNASQLLKDSADGEPARDIIQKYFVLYPEREKRFAELIRQGRIEYLFKLVE